MDLPGGQKERVSIPEYFRRKYKMELKYTGLPGIKPVWFLPINKSLQNLPLQNNPVAPGQQVEVFPLEVLTIMEDQRVPLSKTSPDLNNKLLNVMKFIWNICTIYFRLILSFRHKECIRFPSEQRSLASSMMEIQCFKLLALRLTKNLIG